MADMRETAKKEELENSLEKKSETLPANIRAAVKKTEKM